MTAWGRTVFGVLSGVLAGSLLVLGPAALAAEAPLEEVVVTARHRGEAAASIPVALTALNADALERQAGSYRLQDVQQLAPGLQIAVPNARLTTLAVRGLGTSSFNEGLEGSVGVFLDGVYLARQGMSVLDLADVERVEVLRGPQGTLFGKNVSAGAITVTTRQPGMQPEGRAEATLGSAGTMRLRATLSGPLQQDRLAARLTAFHSGRDGTVRNRRRGERQNDEDRTGGRLQLLSTPADGLSLRLIADHARQDERCCVFLPVDWGLAFADGGVRPNNARVRAQRAGYVLPALDPAARMSDTNDAARSRINQSGLSLQADWDLAGHRLTAISAFRRWHYQPANDADWLGLPLVSGGVASNHRQLSQEIRLASPAGGALDYVAGAYYLHQRNAVESRTRFGAAAAAWQSPGMPAAALEGYTLATRATPRSRTAAGFGHVDWHVAERWTIGAGLRGTHEGKSARVTRTPGGGDVTIPGAAALQAQLGSAYQVRDRMADFALSGLASLSWQATGDTLLYASLANGQKSGGITITVVQPGVNRTFRPETTLSLETGLKTALFDRRLTLALTGYWARVKDFQALAGDASAQTVVFTLLNAGRVRSRGIELELHTRLLRGLTLGLTGAFNDARYTDFRTAPCPPEQRQRVCDFTGRPLSQAPRWTGSIQADYVQPLGSLEGFAGTRLSFRSRTFGTVEQAAATRIPGYGLLDLSAGLRRPDGLWEVALWARNLTDRFYPTGFVTQSLNSSGYAGQPGEPRSWGVTLRSTF